MESVTFVAFADRFLQDHIVRSDHYKSKLHPADGKKKAGIMRQHFGAMSLDTITRADLDAFSAMRARSVGDSTRRKDMMILGTIFKKAVAWKVLKMSPAMDLDKPSEPQHRLRYLSRDEWTRFESACPPWLKPIARLAVCTGMGLKEVVSLRVDDVDRKAATIHVDEDTKTGTRPIHYGQIVGEVLDSQVRRVRSPYVFIDSAGEPYTSRQARDRVSKTTAAVMAQVGLDGATFGTLRHTAASWMVQAGVPLYEVQAILGHSTPKTTQGYAHLAPDFSKRGAAAVDAVLIGSGPPAGPPS